jgi:hypothetical protein
MMYPSPRAPDALALLRDVKQFLFFIEYRLEECQSVDHARAILPDVETALSRLDLAMALMSSDGTHAPSGTIGRVVALAPRARSARARRR